MQIRNVNNLTMNQVSPKEERAGICENCVHNNHGCCQRELIETLVMQSGCIHGTVVTFCSEYELDISRFAVEMNGDGK